MSIYFLVYQPDTRLKCSKKFQTTTTSDQRGKIKAKNVDQNPLASMIPQIHNKSVINLTIRTYPSIAQENTITKITASKAESIGDIGVNVPLEEAVT